jgi:pseudaminic acid biosynthesis-associated methylase
MESQETEQGEKWAGDFGKEYTDRNPQDIDDFDKVYLKNFAITRTELNKEFLKEIPKQAKILEIGCNVAAQLDGLKKLGFTDLTGTDVSKYAIEKAKQKHPEINFYIGSALKLPFKDNEFDLVFTSGVLIHIHPKDLPKAISEIQRISKKYIWCFEYFSQELKEIEYHGNKNILWKRDFLSQFLNQYPNLKIIKQKKLNYIEDDNIDHMFLLEKHKPDLKINNNMKYCAKCTTPSTRPHLIFDEQGICDACRNAEKKHNKEKGIDWDARFEELKQILNKYKRNDGYYDCLIPVSGGKDSTFQVYMMKKLGMNPLAVTFAQCSITKIGQHNLDNLAELGVDHIIFRPNRKAYRKLFKIGFEKFGDSCYPCHLGIHTIPFQIAVKMNIPLIIWGENTQLEYGGKMSNQNILDKKFRDTYQLIGYSPEELLENGFKKQEIQPYIYPSDEELKKIGVAGIFLGYYIKWDARKQVEIVKKLGFQPRDRRAEGSYIGYENVDEKFVRIHDYLMWLKFGFGRTTTQTSIDIRNKRMTRQQAIDLVRKYDNEKPQEYFDEFCEFVGKTPEEADEIFDKFTNKKIFKTDEQGNLIKDIEGNPILKNPLQD